MTPAAKSAADTRTARDHAARAWAILEQGGYGGKSLEERQPPMDAGKHWRTAARDRLQAAMGA